MDNELQPLLTLLSLLADVVGFVMLHAQEVSYNLSNLQLSNQLQSVSLHTRHSVRDGSCARVDTDSFFLFGSKRLVWSFSLRRNVVVRIKCMRMDTAFACSLKKTLMKN